MNEDKERAPSDAKPSELPGGPLVTDAGTATTILELGESTDLYSDDGLLLQRGRLEVVFENNASGKRGYYDPDDRNDVNYLDLTLYISDPSTLFGNSMIPNCSGATLVPASTDPAATRALLKMIADRIESHGVAVKELDSALPPDLTTLFRSLSYIGPKWLTSLPT